MESINAQLRNSGLWLSRSLVKQLAAEAACARNRWRQIHNGTRLVYIERQPSAFELLDGTGGWRTPRS